MNGAVGTRAAAPVASRVVLRRGTDAWPLLVPALVPVALFSVYPLLQGLYLGFTDSRAGRNVVTSFIGLDNYVRLLGNDLFWASFRIGLVWAFAVTVLQLLAGARARAAAERGPAAARLARTLALVPWAMPPVIIAIMWKLLLDPNDGMRAATS